MKLQHIALVLGGAALGAILVLAVPRAEGRTDGQACAQWEVTLGPTATTATTKPQKYGELVVEKAPSGGWEPFAYNSGGGLVYRRCAP